ncbi:Sperm flagellar protein 1, partial [Coelomomyces lativittatus]
LLAEIIHSFHPKWVDLHNYPPANSTTQKIYNWNTLNFKVLRKLRCCLNEETIHQIVHCKSGIVEKLLYDIKKKLQSIPTQNARKNSDSRSTLSTTSNHSSSSRPANLNSDFPKDDSETIMILKETVSLLQEKIEKLEYLIGLKDRKIEELMEYYSP